MTSEELFPKKRGCLIGLLINTFRGHTWFPKWVAEAFYLEPHRVNSGIYPTAWVACKK